jgi:hypothetical protein
MPAAPHPSQPCPASSSPAPSSIYPNPIIKVNLNHNYNDSGKQTYLKNSSRSISSSSLMIYLIVLSNRGITTCSIAFTRRFVARITSSRIVNAVCRDASSTRVSIAFAYTSFARRTCCPPRPKPVRLKSASVSYHIISQVLSKSLESHEQTHLTQQHDQHQKQEA